MGAEVLWGRCIAQHSTYVIGFLDPTFQESYTLREWGGGICKSTELMEVEAEHGKDTNIDNNIATHVQETPSPWRYGTNRVEY